MRTLDRLDHEEARQALALFSRMEAAAKGRDIDAILQLQRTWSPRPSCADATLARRLNGSPTT